MRNLVAAAALTAAMIISTGNVAMAASNKANPDAPGQDRVCLVTTKNPGSFNDVDVADTKWLPRKAAEKQASKHSRTMRVFDYTNDPLVTGGTYASAEQLCKTHFNKT
jgi:hypothetical protein